jgi:hypothetical protein
MFCLHFLMYIENVNITLAFTIYICKCIKKWRVKLYIYISYLHYACAGFHMYIQCDSEFVLQISNSKLEI